MKRSLFQQGILLENIENSVKMIKLVIHVVKYAMVLIASKSTPNNVKEKKSVCVPNVKKFHFQQQTVFKNIEMIVRIIKLVISVERYVMDLIP